MSGRKRKHEGDAAASQPLSEEDQEQLDKAHRHAFLQVMMQRGWMAEEEAKAHFRQLTGREDDTEYPTFTAIIDADISPLQIRLKSMRFPLDGAKYIALINEAADEVSKLGSAFRIPQRDFFKALVEQIASEENSIEGNPYIRGIEAFNLNVQHLQRLGSASQAGSSGGSSKRLSTAEIEVLLKQLVVDGWLAHTPEKSGCYSIGVRTFLELGSFLKELPELPEDTQRAWDRVL